MRRACRSNVTGSPLSAGTIKLDIALSLKYANISSKAVALLPIAAPSPAHARSLSSPAQASQGLCRYVAVDLRALRRLRSIPQVGQGSRLRCPPELRRLA